MFDIFYVKHYIYITSTKRQSTQKPVLENSMFKISKSQMSQIAALEDQVRNTQNLYKEACDAFNGQIDDLYRPVQEAHEQLSSALADARTALEDLVSELQSELDDKSDCWLESERGAIVSDWIDGLENLASDLDAPAIAEKPEPLECDIDDFADMISSIESSPE